MSRIQKVQELVSLPFAGDFTGILDRELLGSEESKSISLLELQTRWLSLLHNQFFIDVKQWECYPSAGVVDILQSLLNQRESHLLLLTPFEYPELLALSADNPPVHNLHTLASNHWKVSADQLENWCIEHDSICAQTYVYLPKPVSGVSWKSGELKRLAEIAKRYELVIVREASLRTPAESSFFHFLPNSTLIFINPYQGFQKMDWQLTYLMQSKSLQIKMAKVEGVLQNQRDLHAKEIMALSLWMDELPKQFALLDKWDGLVKALRKEMSELLHASKLIVSPADQGNALLLNFENYRVPFGRQELYSMEAICSEIEKQCGIQLVSGNKLGLPPNTLVAVMYMNHSEALDWLEKTEIEVGASFLYKRFWNCIDEAQQLMKYLNTLP